MKSNIKTIFLALAGLSLTASHVKSQQAFTYSQYMSGLTPLNTAYSTITESGTASLLGRKQWVGIDGAPSTLLLTGSAWLPKMNGSIGLVLANDQVGIEKQFEAQVFLAKSVTLAENTSLSLSVNAGMRRFTSNYNELDAFDPKFKDNETITSGLAGAGLMIHGSKFYAGLSAPRISLKSTSTQQVKPDFYAMGAYLFDAGAFVKIKPATLVAYSSNLPVRIDVSLTAYLKEQVGLGFNYGSSNELAGILSYYFGNNLGLGYSYQFSSGLNQLGKGLNSTQEVMLNYRFGGKKKEISLL